MKNLVSALKSGLAASVFAAALLPGIAAAETWRGYSFISSASHPDYLHLESFGKKIEEITGGAITTRTNVGGSLPIPGTAITEAVADNIVTFAHDGYYTGNLPIGALPMLPMLVPDHETFLRMMRLVEPVLAAELDKLGVVLLATYNFPIQTIWGIPEVERLDQLKGMKVRVGNLPIAEFMLRNGATPVTLATADVAAALERAVVNGIVTASAGGGRLWGDMLNSNYRLPLNYDLMMIIANKEAFEAQDPAIQEKIREAARASAASLTAELASLEDSVTAELQEKGLKVTVASDEDIAAAREAVKSYWPEWAAGVGPVAEALLNEVLAEIAK